MSVPVSMCQYLSLFMRAMDNFEEKLIKCIDFFFDVGLYLHFHTRNHFIIKEGNPNQPMIGPN